MMERPRIRGSCAALLLASLFSVDAIAHPEDDGPIGMYAGFYEMGSSSGYFDYELRWHLKGSNNGVSHNKFVSTFWRIESGATNRGPWSLFSNIKGVHQGNIGPVPTHRWYRFHGGGGLCYGFRCYRKIEFGPYWRPAQACSGSGHGGGGRRGPW